jgi:hypothetical protein
MAALIEPEVVRERVWVCRCNAKKRRGIIMDETRQRGKAVERRTVL